jgi:hypothetical protein
MGQKQTALSWARPFDEAVDLMNACLTRYLVRERPF